MLGKLNIKQAFGISQNAKTCLEFCDERNLVYSAGHNAVVMNLDTKEQLFIPGATQVYHSLGITALAVSGPKKVIAVAERAEPVAGCTFYDTTGMTLRRRKVVQYPELGSKTIASIAFSNDGRYFLMQGGAPDWNLTMWNVEKAPKLMAHVKLNSSEDISVDECSFCPWDANICVVVGKGMMKIFRFSEGHFRPHNISLRRDTAHFTSHAWLNSDDRLIVGNKQGEILLIENLEFRAIVYPTGAGGEENLPILSLCATNNGFLAGTVAGELRVFDKNEEAKEHYKLDKQIYIPQDKSDVISIAVGTEDNAIVVTNNQQLFNVMLHTQGDAGKDSTDPNQCDYLLTQFHSPAGALVASITGISFALWKPIVATCGKDRTVRLWNLTERVQETRKDLTDEPVGLSMHPSGLYIVVAFIDRLKVFSILLTGLTESKDIPVRQCNAVCYSTGGQFIACSSGSSILVFDANTGTQITALRGHTSRIRDIKWIMNDSRMITVGAEGSVLTWDVMPTLRLPDEDVTGNPYLAGASNPEGTRSYVVTAEKNIREVLLERIYDTSTGLDITPSVPRELSLKRSVGPMIFDESRSVVFMGTTDDDAPGAVITTMVSPNLSSMYETVSLHSGVITAMQISPDGSQLVTGDESGILIVSDIEGQGGHKTLAMKMIEGTAAFEFHDEVLIQKQDLEYKKKKIIELTGKVDELKLNNEHQLRLKEMDHKAKVKEISTRFNKDLEIERQQYNEMQEEKGMVERSFKEQMTDSATTNEIQLSKIKSKYEYKLNQEEERHRALKSDTLQSHQRWNDENSALIESHQDYLRDLTAEYEEKLRIETQEQKDVLQTKQDLQVESDVMLKDIDEDGNMEVSVMKTRFESRLKSEDEAGVALMAEHAVLKKNLQLLVKDANQQKDDIKKLKDREQRLIETIKSLEKDIQSHKKEMREREETISDKEKRIFDLKKKNQELEKFRFVLDYKIKELKLQIAPREAEIATMRKQIEEMDLELEQYHKSNRALNLMIGDLKLKLDGIRKELDSQVERMSTNTRIQAQIKRDVRDLGDARVDNATLKAKVIALYRTYVQEESTGAAKRASGTGSGNVNESEDPQAVYNRDRETMERNLEGLKKALKQDAVSFKRDLGKMQRENVMLTSELNELRKDSRNMQLQKKAIEKAYTAGLNTKDRIVELMGVLHMKVPRALQETAPALKKKSSKTKTLSTTSYPAAPGKSTEPALEPTATPIQPDTPNNGFESPHAFGRVGSPRTAALRTTSAGGHVLDKARTAKLAGGKTSVADHWEAWREIQIQHDQMRGLEEKLQNLCFSLEIDPIQMLSSIDATLASNHHL